MNIRHATLDDIPQLAELNRQLQEDERTPKLMTNHELAIRMTGWLNADYQAILFELAGAVVAYAVYRAGEDEDDLYLRQFHVSRSHRRRGMGREALALFREQVVKPGQSLTLEAYVHNEEAIAFWRAIGFQDHTLSFRIEG